MHLRPGNAPSISLQLLVLELALELLHLGDLANGLVEVVLVDGVPVVLDSEQATVGVILATLYFVWMEGLGRRLGQEERDLRFGDHVTQIGAIQLIAHLDHALEIDLALLLYACSVDLQNLHPANFIRQRNLNFPVQTPSSQQRRVQCIRSVCCHDDLGLAQVVEAVQLVQELHKRALNLTIGRCTLTKAPSTDSVDLIHEDNAGFMLFRVTEHLADQACGFSNVLVDNSG